MNKNKKDINVKDVFYSAEYKKKAEKINNTEIDTTNPDFEEKKEELDKIITKAAEKYKKKKVLTKFLVKEGFLDLKEPSSEMFLKLLKEQEKNKENYVNNNDIYSGDDFYNKLVPESMKFIAESNNASISFLQRKFVIGFSKAAAVIDLLEENKLISGYDSEDPKPREVYFKLEEVEKILKENNNFKK